MASPNRPTVIDRSLRKACEAPAYSSRSAGTANREKSAFRARNVNCRERIIRPCVVYYQTGPMRDERDRAPENSTGRSRGSVVAASSESGKCALGAPGAFASGFPSPPHLRVARGPIVPTTTWSLIHGCMRLRDRFAESEIQADGTAAVQECTSARKMLQECKKVQKNRTVESGFKRGEAGRMSFCDLLIGSARHGLAPSGQSFAVDGRKCNERTPILFTRSH